VSARFIDVQVEEHPELPDGCSLRFRENGERRAVALVRYESEAGTAGIWRVEAARADGTRAPAQAVSVDDSSAGTATLIVGGEHGLRLTSLESGDTASEPYLLLAESAVVA
jgi:hypothetical protein